MKRYLPILIIGGIVIGGGVFILGGKNLPGRDSGKMGLDPEKDIKVVYHPNINLEKPNAYIAVSYNGKEIEGPTNMQLQQEQWEIKTLELLNNDRRQIEVRSLWGPYSSVSYFYDFDGKEITPLCHTVFEKYAMLDTSCQFMTNRGFVETKDLDGDGVMEINVLHDADSHTQSSVYSLDFKWDGGQGKYYLDEVFYDDGKGSLEKVTESEIYLIGN